MSRRAFNSGERQVLWLAASGRCAKCGCELEAGWHADHVTPYSKGGSTDVVNGQALCGPCNRRKGDGMGNSDNPVGTWPEALQIREWQDKARAEFENKVVVGDQQSYLCVATPGAGKTLFALAVAHDLLSSGVVERVVIVTPTAHLKEQWIQAATRVGIHVDDKKNAEGLETEDFHGAVMTYHQLSRGSLLQRRGCSRARTLAVLDEVHHAGGESTWGRELKEAFELASSRLLLTGTPWRDPASVIPFVHYDGSGRSVSDFEYSYSRGLADGVCRPINFWGHDGEINFHTISGDYKTATLKDEIAQDEASRRLRTALDAEGNWLKSIIKEADAKLSEIRTSNHPQAGGLIVAKDQAHARQIVKVLQRITGEQAVLAVSDDKEAADNIANFAASSEKWIVAVKMVSEGVDIPRLRVGVYATNTIAKLFFNQVVGRFVRMQPGLEEQSSYLYLPSDERLLAFAKTIHDQQVHELGDVLDEQLERDIADAERLEREPDLFLSGTSGDAVLDEVISGESQFTAEEIRQARIMKKANPAMSFIPDEMVVQIMRQARAADAPGHEPHVERQHPDTDSAAPEKARKDQLKEMRAKLNRRVYAVAMKHDMEPRHLNYLVNERIVKKREQFTIADCKEAFEFLKEYEGGSPSDTEAV